MKLHSVCEILFAFLLSWNFTNITLHTFTHLQVRNVPCPTFQFLCRQKRHILRSKRSKKCGALIVFACERKDGAIPTDFFPKQNIPSRNTWEHLINYGSCYSILKTHKMFITLYISFRFFRLPKHLYYEIVCKT